MRFWKKGENMSGQRRVVARDGLADSDGQAGAIMRWFAVAMLCIAQIVSTIDRGMLALVVDPVRAELHISDMQIALLQGFAFSIFYVVAGVLLGLVADVVNRKWLLISGILIWSAATLASGLADSFGHLFTARLFVGIGEAVLAPCAVTIIADLFPVSRRGKPMALYIFGSMIAFGVGSIVTGFVLEMAPRGVFDWVWILEGRSPWRVAFILAGGFGLLLALAFVLVREPDRAPARIMPDGTGSLRSGLYAMLSNWRIYLPLYLSLAFFGMGISVIFNWSPMLLTRVFGFQIDEASKLLGLGHIVWATLGAVLAGVIVDRVVRNFGTVGLIRLGGIAALLAVPSSLAMFSGHGLSSVLLISEVTFASAIFGSAMLSTVAEVAPARTRGLSTSLYAFFMTLVGASTGPILVAFLTDQVFGTGEAIGYSIAIIGTTSFVMSAALAVLASGNLGAEIAAPNSGISGSVPG
jgi:MFS family permease